ncbi:MAG: hypothetical protein WBQ72_04310 [Terriglobales bacterium]
MNAGTSSVGPQNQDVLRSLLHIASQPLTTLHCVLETSFAQDATAPTESAAVALEQTERVIEAVRLMREYLEADRGCGSKAAVSLNGAVEKALENLSVLAEARGVPFFLLAAGSATALVSETWLVRSLQYLIADLLENEPTGGAVIIVLEKCASEAILSAHNLQRASAAWHQPSKSGLASKSGAATNPLREVRAAIARRALESAGAFVEFWFEDRHGFSIRFPRSA